MTMADYEDRERWTSFRKMLDDAGVQRRCLWETRTSPDRRYPDLVCWQLANGRDKGERLMIVQHFTDNGGHDQGFALYFPSATIKMEDDLRRIMGE